jgi:hypothetical protein
VRPRARESLPPPPPVEHSLACSLLPLCARTLWLTPAYPSTLLFTESACGPPMYLSARMVRVAHSEYPRVLNNESTMITHAMTQCTRTYKRPIHADNRMPHTHVPVRNAAGLCSSVRSPGADLGRLQYESAGCRYVTMPRAHCTLRAFINHAGRTAPYSTCRTATSRQRARRRSRLAHTERHLVRTRESSTSAPCSCNVRALCALSDTARP